MHLERLILILEAVGQRGASRVRELCEATGLPKPTTYRLVHELVGTGLLEPNGGGTFILGARLTRICRDDNSDAQLLTLVAPELRRAANKFGAAFFLSRLRGRSVEIIHVETPETGVSYLHPGLGRRPLHACSCSKAIAAFLSEPLLAGALRGRLRAYTDYTLTRIEDLKTEFARIRESGYAECIEEIERGMCSVAAPLAPSGPHSTVSIGAAGSVRVFSESFRKRMGETLVRLGAGFAAELDGQVPVAGESPA